MLYKKNKTVKQEHLDISIINVAGNFVFKLYSIIYIKFKRNDIFKVLKLTKEEQNIMEKETLWYNNRRVKNVTFSFFLERADAKTKRVFSKVYLKKTILNNI